MKEKISPFIVFGFFGALASILLIVLFGTVGLEEVILSDSVSAATSSNVAVTAEVTTTITCDSSPGSTAFGTLSSTATSTASPNASTTMACTNSGGGCTLYVKDAGNTASSGLATSDPAYLIPSPNAAADASTTLVAGTEGYGIQATTTSTGLTIDSRYDQTGDIVGGLSLTDIIIASSTADITDAEVIVTHMAAISEITPPGIYEDTITYSCLVND